MAGKRGGGGGGGGPLWQEGILKLLETQKLIRTQIGCKKNNLFILISVLSALLSRLVKVCQKFKYLFQSERLDFSSLLWRK